MTELVKTNYLRKLYAPKSLHSFPQNASGWLDTHGKFRPVQYGGHSDFACWYIWQEKGAKNIQDPQQYLEENGWIHISNGDMDFTKPPNNIQLNEVTKWWANKPEANKYINRSENFDLRKFYEKQDQISLIAKQISKRKNIFASVTFSFPYEQQPKEIAEKQNRLGDLYNSAMQNQMNEEKFKQHDEEIEKLEKEIAEHWPEVNFSNDNARAVLKSLGYQNPNHFGKLQVADLLQKILVLKNSQKQQSKIKQHERPYIPPYRELHMKQDEKEFKKGPWIIETPLASSEIMEKILRLERLAIKAKEMGITEIFFG